MTYTQLSDQFFLYTFSGEQELNVPLLVNDNKALLIDTGYTEQAEELRDILQKEGLTPEIVIHSHYHPDHFYGNHIFGQAKFMGSEHYKQNFELFEALNMSHKYIPPTHLIKDGDTFQYGDCELRFFNLPGHCTDLIATLINGEYLHVGDLIMRTNSGQDMLPYLSYDGDIDRYIQSLDLLKTIPAKTLIPAHGTLIEGPDAIQATLDKYYYYLRKLKELGSNAKVEDCIQGSTDQFATTTYHNTNIKNAFGVML